MGYKIVIPVIAIVAVLFASGISFQEVYADHLEKRGAAAYLFDCTGDSAGAFAHWQDIRNFMNANNGVYHGCGYNWINQAYTDATENTISKYHLNDLGHNFDEMTITQIQNEPCTHVNCFTNAIYKSPVRHVHGGSPFGWNDIQNQYALHTSPPHMPELADTKNTKLLLNGYSWGTAAVTMMAINVDQPVDFVMLIDTVGPNGQRATLVKDCGNHEAVFCLPALAGDRVFPSRVKYVAHFFQQGSSWPSDYFVGGFANPNGNVHEWIIDCPQDQIDAKNCHGWIATDTNYFMRNHWVTVANSMNNKPYFEPGVLPTQIILNEGESFSNAIHTPDAKAGGFEELHQMDMAFRDLTSNPELDVDINPGALYNINNNNHKLRAGTFTLNALDNIDSNIILQVEDNGFPCDNCTEKIINDNGSSVSNCDTPGLVYPGGIEQCRIDMLADDFIEPDSGIFLSMGATGDWSRVNIPVIVNSLPPVPAIVLDSENIFHFSATDPSPLDVAHGLVFDVDWDDGNVESSTSFPSLNSLIDDGSFEDDIPTTPNPESFTTIEDPNFIGSWQVIEGSVDWIDGYWTGSDGQRSLDMSGAPGDAPNRISQSFSTVVDRTYLVSFDLAGNPAGPSPKGLYVDAGDVVQQLFNFDITGKSLEDMGWQNESFYFTATDTTTTLTFSSGHNDGAGPALDNVKVQEMFVEMSTTHPYSAPGTYTVTLTVTDKDGDSDFVTQDITIPDEEPPTISAPADINTYTDPGSDAAVVTYPDPTVSDNAPGVTFTCTPASGTTFSIGTTPVYCTATDTSGNEASASFSIIVQDGDIDDDGFNSSVFGGLDCNDDNAAINPDTIEKFDGVDNNCDGAIDEGFTISLAKGQSPEVNEFLSYGNLPEKSQTGVSSIDISIQYGPTTDPLSFTATLNGAPVDALFTPTADGRETVSITLEPGRNVLILSIEGEKSSGKISKDTDRLTFVS